MAGRLEKNLRSLWERRDGRYDAVDGMRAIAVLWVIAYHTFKFVGAPLGRGPEERLFRVVNRGLLGVDVFFVLSGFLIGSLLMRELDTSGRISFGHFYLRRALRILPAYWVTLAIVALLGGENAEHAWANVLFVNDLLPEREQFMKWTWSLAIEEQFYFAFPLVLSIVAASRRRRLALLVLLFAAGIAIRAAVVWQNGIHLPSADHSRILYDALYDKPHTRYVELLAGAIVAHLVASGGAMRKLHDAPIAATLGTLAAFAVIAASSVVAQPFFAYGLPASFAFLYYTLSHVLFSSAVAFVLFACVARAGAGAWLSKVLSWRAFLPIAQLSYSAYLVHVMIIDVGLDVGPFHHARTVSAMLVYLAVIPVVSLVAAVPLYLLVEKPMMNLRERFPRTRG